MSYMTYADDLATMEMLEGDYVKEALETGKLLEECLDRCNLERHLGKQVLGSRKRAEEIEEKADGKLGEFTPIATYLGGSCVPSVSSTEEPKKRCARADEGAAGVAIFVKRNVDHKLKLTLFKAWVQGALTSAGERRCYSKSELKRLESKQCTLARLVLGKRGYGKIKEEKAKGVSNEMVRRRAKLHTIESVLRQGRLVMLRTLVPRDPRPSSKRSKLSP